VNPNVFLPVPVNNATRAHFILYFDAWPTKGYFLTADYISTRGKDRLSSGGFAVGFPGVQPGKMLILALVQHQDAPSLFGFVQYLNGTVFPSPFKSCCQYSGSMNCWISYDPSSASRLKSAPAHWGRFAAD
jgi:hypothetical protein